MFLLAPAHILSTHQTLAVMPAVQLSRCTFQIVELSRCTSSIGVDGQQKPTYAIKHAPIDELFCSNCLQNLKSMSLYGGLSCANFRALGQKRSTIGSRAAREDILFANTPHIRVLHSPSTLSALWQQDLCIAVRGIPKAVHLHF